MSAPANRDLAERFVEFYRNYYREEIGRLAQRYPKEQRSLVIEYSDLQTFDPSIADDWVEKPDQFQEYAEEGLRLFDLPADVKLGQAHVRLTGLPDDQTYYPGEQSPSDDKGTYVTFEGQVSKATEVYSVILEAAFECQRCGTMTYIPQPDTKDFQEPHECQGCERQGPFRIDFDQSTFIDGQKLRIEEPPEIAQGGNPSHIDVYVEDELVERVEPGDKASISGILHLRQKSSNNKKQGTFTTYLEGQAIDLKDTEFEDIDITPEDEREIHAVVDDPETDIFDLGVGSIAPSHEGDEEAKLGIFLQLLGGVRTELPDGTHRRGDPHMLLIGDPSTGKSTLMDAAERIAPRAVSVSGHGASASGLTAAAVRDDFSDNGQWALEAGALVHAHKGLACVDELDKIQPDAVKSMHKALEQQRIPISKAGINTTLPAETAVLAAANPKHSRWDPHLEDHEQIDLDSALISRFGLIFKFVDRPDPDHDDIVADTILLSKDLAKKYNADPHSVDESELSEVEPALPIEFLRKYIAYARKNYEPVFRDASVRKKMREAYVTLRSANGYDENAAIPVSTRKLEDVLRFAEASARGRLSNVIEEQDVERAQELVGDSLRQFGTNADGNLDVDVIESGTSMTQKQRREQLLDLIVEEQPTQGALDVDDLCEAAEEQLGLEPRMVKDEVEVLAKKGELYQPGGPGTARVFGE
ncbi:minichromosome maintenance protein MCM [Haloferax volcanii]|uniref:minichromosome maintenance protein MCM n=1 Tax=Haloferax volcanii TaxID=2246 RepID=UPI00249B782C|nr:minichromosome maintenance protein MCM [Haloferax alexandrinus]WEL29874.1 Replicative DNA helicase Mcm [Haloferax alexandrinus]